ncbi:hypothetical protein F4Y93_00870 [Candidatus Poribacteria bacterium]|nr:hypothetical protein [Candidatus Poribacteria bacterium]
MMMFYPGIHWDSGVECNGSITPKKEVDMAVKTSDESKSALFVVGDEEAKLSIAHAMAKGYRITLDGDGNAEVINPDGRAYYVQNFECDCPDKRRRGGSYHGRCKHEGWIGQMRPCEMCGAIMYLGEFKTAFGECQLRFECSACGNARDDELVSEERMILRDGGPQDERLMPEGRCRQAIAWLDKCDNARYVWFVVRQSPELAPIMVRLLAEAEHGELGDEIAKVFSVLSPSAEHEMRDRLKKGRAELCKLPKGQSLLSGLLDHLGVESFEEVVNEDLPNVMGFFEDVYRSAKQ